MPECFDQIPLRHPTKVCGAQGAATGVILHHSKSTHSEEPPMCQAVFGRRQRMNQRVNKCHLLLSATVKTKQSDRIETGGYMGMAG